MRETCYGIGWSEAMRAEIAELKAECSKRSRWIDDLQSGMYINCVYCGHRYGPRKDAPTSMREVLYKHIEQCPKHPLSKMKAERDKAIDERVRFSKVIIAFLAEHARDSVCATVPCGLCEDAIAALEAK